MKKIFLAFLILISVRGISQVSISQLPTYTGSPVGTFVPLVQGGSTKKIDGSKLGQVSDSTKIPYLAKNNNFTGNDTFPTIAVLNNSYGAGIKTSGDATIIGDVQGANNGTTLTVNDDLDEVIINGGLGFTGGQKITSISTDTSLAANSNSVLSTQATIKAYVGNHQGGGGIGYQTVANLSNDGTMAANSATLYPSQQATRTYAAGLVVGLLNDRGNYNASSNVFPSSGGSGTAGAIQKGDLWYIDTAGTLGGTSVVVGSSLRALTNSPGQTASNWDILNVGLGYTPENILNKSTSVASDSGSTTKYPTVQSVGRYAQSLSNLSNNATSDSASTTKYPSVQAITRFVKANSISYTDTVITLSGTSTTTSKYTFVKPTNSGYLLYTNPNPTIGETDYIYNITGAYSLNKSFYLRSNTGTYFYATASSGSYTSAITVDSGRQVRLQYVGSGEWLYTVQNQGLNPQDVNNLATSITPSDSSSNTLYPSVNAVKNYVQANSAKDTILTIVDTFSVSHTNGTSIGYTTVSVGSSSSHLTLSPSSTQWFSAIDNRSIVKVLIETNLDSLDMASNNLGDNIQAGISIAYYNNGGVSNSVNIAFEQNTGQAVSDGYIQYRTPNGSVLNSPAQIGDATTLSSIMIGASFGLPLNFGVVNNIKYYYLPFIYIPSSAATKSYKFKFTIYYK